MPDHTLDLPDRLVPVLPPAAPDGGTAQVVAHFDAVAAGLRGHLDLVEAWRQWLPTLPEPAARQSLQELVQAARRALRDERSRLDLVELTDRLALVDRIRAGLQP